TTLVNICLAGLITFNFYEPFAEEIDGIVQGTILAGFEDALCMIILFAIVLGCLRALTNNLANTDLELPALLQQVASGAIALVSGYILAGILVVMLQTLPWS